MNHQTDEEIIHNVLAGNRAVYSLLVNKYSRKVFTLALTILLNKEDAEEAAQDAFVKAFTALASFKQESRFSTWLYRIVVNTALNKKKGNKPVFVFKDEETTGEEETFVYALIEQLGGDQKKYIQLAMLALRDEERICIAMYYLNELSVSEIAELTGLTTTNIKVLLHRGRKHLYDELYNLLKTEITNLM